MKEFSPFRLDAANQCLWRGTERVLLTPKAFAVLCYLVDRAGRLVSQDELLDSLWPDTFVQPEVLKTHILDVRTALGDSARQPRFIETMPRRGYRFVAPVRETYESVPGPAAQANVNVVGRVGELRKLEECFERARAGERQIVFVSGEAGAGKTTLVDAFEHRIANRGVNARIVRGQCVEGHGTQEPYYPVLESLGHLLRGAEGEPLVELLASQAPTWLAQFPALLKPEHRAMLREELMGATKERMLREICEALEAITAKKTLVLILEDVHWVDSSTVDLIQALATRRIRAQLMVLATYRPVSLALTQHPLKLVKQHLALHQLCQEVAVPALTPPEVREYLAALCGAGPLPDGLAELIYSHSEGNPLFLVEVIEDLQERGFLSAEDNAWRLNVPLSRIAVEVPRTLRASLELHIDRRLSDEKRQVLEAASVSGVSFTADAAAWACEMSPDRFEQICETLAETAHFVRSAGHLQMPDGTVTACYQFVHGFYREVFYKRISTGRCARLHQRTAERIELRHAQNLPEVAAQLALHFEAAFDWSHTVTCLQLVAENEVRRFAYLEAISVLQHARELVPKLPESERAGRDMDLLEKMGALYYAVEDIDRTIETLELMIQRAAELGDVSAEIRGLVQLAFPLFRASPTRCLEAVERALELSEREQDPRRKAQARLTCLFWRAIADKWNVRDAETQRIELEQASQILPRETLATLIMLRAVIQGFCSEYKEAALQVEASLPAMVEAGNMGHRAAEYVLAWQLQYSGQWGKELKVLETWGAMGKKNASHLHGLTLLGAEAQLRLQAMDLAGTLKICEAILPDFAGLGHGTFRRNALVVAGSAEVELGLHDQAYLHLSQVRQSMERDACSLDWYWRMPLQAALASLALHRGNVPDARREAKRFLECSLATSERTWQARAWETSARVALAEGDRPEAQQAISNALALCESLDLPLAALHVYPTAMQVFPERAEHYSQLGAANARRLAGSLEGYDALRKTFLSSRLVRSVLPDGADEGKTG